MSCSLNNGGSRLYSPPETRISSGVGKPAEHSTAVCNLQPDLSATFNSSKISTRGPSRTARGQEEMVASKMGRGAALQSAVARTHHQSAPVVPRLALPTKTTPCRERARELYQSRYTQLFIAMLIMGNFITNVVEKQIDPWNELYPEYWLQIEFVWNSIFIVELLWNAFGSFHLTSCASDHFLRSGWNIFDVCVVAVSVPSMLGIVLPGPMSQLRMLRAFRVFRLFKRVKALNKIFVSLGRAVPGIINAGCVMLLVMCIYAILAVDLFGRFAVDGGYINAEGRNVTLRTTRGMSYGDEYYGNFARSIYTLFQVLTGESWSEAIARPIVFSEGPMALAGAGFYISFILICGIVLINVAVAVLLEKMVDGGSADEEYAGEDGSQGGLEGQSHPGEGHPPASAADAPAPQPAAAATRPPESQHLEMIRELQLEVGRLRDEARDRDERLTAALHAVASSVSTLSHRRREPSAGASRRSKPPPPHAKGKADYEEAHLAQELAQDLAAQPAALGIPVPPTAMPEHRPSTVPRPSRRSPLMQRVSRPRAAGAPPSPVVQGLVA